jgi:glucose/mannose transport system permease protein
MSMTASRTFPSGHFIGLAQYQRLFDNERWMLSLHNLAVYGVLFVLACLVIGFLLAVFIDQNVTGEGVLRTVFLYPYAMSFVATGLVWQWLLQPGRRHRPPSARWAGAASASTGSSTRTWPSTRS